uniref:Uncharacterized protein n=1 Tax=Cacopsylla melanoneura TaxID=428564 RepID=A0A8D8ZBF6_9HEMI
MRPRLGRVYPDEVCLVWIFNIYKNKSCIPLHPSPREDNGCRVLYQDKMKTLSLSLFLSLSLSVSLTHSLTESLSHSQSHSLSSSLPLSPSLSLSSPYLSFSFSPRLFHIIACLWYIFKQHIVWRIFSIILVLSLILILFSLYKN